MIDAVILWSLRRRGLVLLAALSIFVFGAFRAVRMPVDVFPDLTPTVVTVVAEAHGMAPEEVESLVTFPLETAINGAFGVRRVRSSTGVGIAIVWVEFENETDTYRARQVVSERLLLAQDALPPDIPRPVLAPVSSVMGEILFLALTSDRHTPMELKTTADWVLRRRLLAVPGVSQVVPTGGDTKQYQVLVHPERLASYGIALGEITSALRAANANASSGFYVENAQEYLIRSLGRVRSLDDIAESVVAVRSGEPVLVRHLADVREGPAIKRGEGSFNAHPAVVLGIQKQPGANTLELTQRLEIVIDDVQRSLPAGMVIQRHIFRQATFIEAAVHNVKVALRDGALLVVLVVAIFLASGRATLVTLTALPLSLAVAVLVLSAAGVTLNTMTLGGMAIAVGELVDDAIVDVENVVRRWRENLARPVEARVPRFTVVYDASREVRGSVVFATLVILLMFLPMFFLSGVEGRLLRPLALAYMTSLAASLAVALTVTPALCLTLLGSSRATVRQGEAAVVRWLKTSYAPLLDYVLPRWRLLGAASLVALGLAVASLGLVGRSFLPNFNEGTLTLSAVTLPGTSLAESDRIGRRIEEIVLAQPEVTATARRTGRAEFDEHAQDVNAAEIDVSLRPGRDKATLLTELRREFSLLPGVNIIIGQPISHRIDHMLSGTRANLAVKVFGDDRAELRRLAEQVRTVMAAVPGIVDLALEQPAELPVLSLRLNRAAVAQYGLRMGDVTEVVETAFAGTTVSEVREQQALFALVVRYDPNAVQRLEDLRATLVQTPTGARVPLHALADIRYDVGPNTISRENVQRKMVVMSNVSGRDLHSVVEDLRGRVQSQVSFPSGYQIEYGGQFESAEGASRTLLMLGAAVIAGVALLLAMALGSVRDACLVLANLPFALVGGVAGIFLSGGVVSVASLVGIITLFGITTRNGLMLVSHIHHLRDREGVSDVAEAVRRACLERLAPILMTALAAGFALVPMALGGGKAGNEIQTPMAVVTLAGLFSSTLLNMVVLPALYVRFGSRKAVAS